jgi:uncharacterized protein YqgC (DUF456 family)
VIGLILAQLAVVVLNAGFVLLILLGLPGTWLAIATAGLCEWLTDRRLFHWGVFVAVVVIALFGELWELLSSATRAKRAGAKRRGAIGAFLGGIGGAILGTFLIPAPLLGTLIGGGLGAFALSAALEHEGGRDVQEAIRIGQAAGIGHVLGLVGKLACGVLVWLILAVAVFVP